MVTTHSRKMQNEKTKKKMEKTTPKKKKVENPKKDAGEFGSSCSNDLGH